MSLADCEGSAEMVYHWLGVQMLSGMELPRPEQKSISHRRHHDSQEDEQRPRAMVNGHAYICLVNNSSVESQHDGTDSDLRYQLQRDGGKQIKIVIISD